MVSKLKDKYQEKETLFKLLANAKRLEILNFIARKKEVTVTEIVDEMKIRKANVSQHLATLRYNGIIDYRRQGKNSFYRIKDSQALKYLL
jgi:ArsR family transcriptional regulator, virulence genes transcriptional regulator